MCVFVLVYFGTYRTSRAPYAGWWSAVVLMSSASSSMYLLGDTDFHRLTDSLGQGLAPISAAFVLAAARSLLAKRSPWWMLYPPGVVVFVVAVLNPRNDGVLPGTPALLVAMAVLFLLTTVELWKVVKVSRGGNDHELSAGTRAAALFMAGASTIVAVMYTLRVVVYSVAGPTSDFYMMWTGPQAVTYVILIMLVVVTYTVSSLSQLEVTSNWRIRALRDDLTGLLSRNAITESASVVLRESARAAQPPIVIVADLDHFKDINDEFGHAAGDTILRAFGEACHRLVSREGLACRMGGEEFVFLLTDLTVDQAKTFTRDLSAAFGDIVGQGPQMPTVSYGIAVAEPKASLHELIERADQALYRAKKSGRDRTTVYQPPQD